MASSPKKIRRSSGNLADTPASTKLSVSAQILNFEPGTYTIELGDQEIQAGPSGFKTPCVRLDTLHQPGRTAVAFFSALADTNLITPGGMPAFMRVVGIGTVAVLLTVYRFENMPTPEVRVRLLEQGAPVAKAVGGEQQVPAEELPQSRATLLVHIEGVGDRSVPIGSWGGELGSGRTIEGFAVRLGPGSPEKDIEYQAALGLEWDTPWFPADEFCGSRGMMLPLLGVRLRTTGESSQRLVCRYWGSFVGLGERGPFEQGALCACDGATLEALRVELVAPDKSLKAIPVKRRTLLGKRR